MDSKKIEKVQVYCERGCNVTDVDADDPWTECAACGAIMRPEYFDNLSDIDLSLRLNN